MITKVVEHLNVTENIKHALNKSAEFGVCVANHLCDCLALPYPPVMYACFGALGLKCIKDVLHLSPHLLACALACPNSTIIGFGATNTTTIINMNSTVINTNSTLKHDHEALKDFCNNKCKKKD
ncbi:uncharacterized protein LOC133793580 [Humulus lupulus]|uniref:uncharacterized protein LOC133793580 n=1 Tax=Humulus lupulus TaxID=3486 RepID=UPI002B413B26|nr:uncharacterized protein LOC133793580 [Humulus lupulus]